MSFFLKDLESALPEDIVRKGLDYYSSERVDNLAVQDDKWQADVYGTDTYTVSIAMQGEEVLNWFCDCPYDWGPVCKHVAAVLITIRSERAEAELEKMRVASSLHQGRNKTPESPNPVEQIIRGLKKEELREALKYLAIRENEVRAYLLTKYADRVETSSKQEFVSVVQTLIKAHYSGSDGYLDYRSSARLGDQLYNLVWEAEGGWSTVYLCEAVIEEAATAIMDADDSGGEIEGAIDFAFDQLREMALPESEVAPKIIAYLFDMAISQQAKKKYDEFDWGERFLGLAIRATRSRHQADKLMQELEAHISRKQTEQYGRYALERAELQKNHLLEVWYSPEQAQTHLREHLHLPGFRRMALETAWDAKQYDEVRQLAEAGIKQHTEQGYAGLVAEWESWLVRYAEVMGDQEMMIGIIEKKYLSRGETQYFRKLKRLIPGEVFEEKVEQYIRYFKENNQYGGFNYRLAAIYQEEKRLADLMEMIAAHPNLGLLDDYRKLLSSDYRELYIKLYDKGVRHKMEHSSDRQKYRECCYYLEVLLELGAQDNVRQIITDWEETYPRRRAMLEEIKRIRL